MTKTLFPKDFYWGASTASHQVEGGTYNQWTVWELAHAKELATTAHSRLSGPANHFITKSALWPAIEPLATNPENYVSGKGVDHYHRYQEDFDIVKSLNLNAFRFGVEWARLEPEKGVWDQEAIEHYKKYIAGLKERGIEPFLNIFHWTLPVWFDQMGAFKHRRNIKYFDRFVKKIAEEFGKDITYFITINEPNVYATFSYISGDWPPAEKNFISFAKVYWHLALAHRHAYKILKRANHHAQIGIAAQLANIAAKRPRNIMDVFATEWMRYFWNWWFIRRMRKEQDFVGFNYYFTDYYQFDDKGVHIEDPKFPTNDLGWYMEPEGLYPLLLRVWDHYHKPIFVTENGVADMFDTHRRWWLEQTMIAMEKAISEGVNVKGYFHWSLLDNFEWAYGWWPKFGLVAVDRKHAMKRTIRPSALWWAGVLKRIREE